MFTSDFYSDNIYPNEIANETYANEVANEIYVDNFIANHTIKEYRYIMKYDLRLLCIEHDWFTYGDNKEYDKFLNLVGPCKNITTNKLLKLALIIVKYSRKDTWEELEIPGIIHCLNEIAIHTFVTEERR